MTVFLRALRFFRPDARGIAGVLGLMILGIGANLLKPWPVALLVDSVLGDRPWPAFLSSMGGNQAACIAWLAGATVLLHVLQGGLSAAQNYVSIGIGLRGLRRVRNEVFNWLQRLSLRFHQSRSTGDLIHRAAWDTYSFQTLFQQGLITLLNAGLSFALMVAVMLGMNWRLTFVALGIVPLLLLAIRFFGRRMTERGAAAQRADSQVTSLVQQGMAALPLTQSYTREEHESAKFATHSAHAQTERMSQHAWEVAYWFAITTVFGLGMAGIVWLGAHQVLAGQATVGGLLVFLTYLSQFYEPLNQLSHMGATVSGANAGAARVFEILDTAEEVKDTPQARPVVRAAAPAATGALVVRGAINFERVSFHYTNDRDILQELTFALAPGQSAALIGPSGVGKSTLLNLLPRFFDPTAGAVRLDGADLRELRVRDLRAQIAIVLQEPVLLPASLSENIAYGRPGATRAEIEAAARAANADAFIRKLPHGYDTLVGDGAARLSVGERQRLNLARAFLKDAPILLLDEPTSALDAESEAQVVASLRELMRGRTTLMVAHRLSTIRHVDRILVLDSGRLVEHGTHEELMAGQGYYSRVVSGQVALDE